MDLEDEAPPQPTKPPPLPPPLVEPAAPVESRPIPKGSNLPVISKQRRGSVVTIIGWVALAAIVIALGVAIAERETVMARYPEARALYGAVGFATPPLGAGLAITDETCSRTMQEGLPVLICEGRLRNNTKFDQRVPALRGALLDAGGRELQAWTFSVSAPTLGPNQSVPFRTEVRQPASAATEWRVTFVANP
ncbi:MAG TPA: DUF3426 domain-containing protein [Alphaproteobacteria bacterium]|nr:DUF3426 domain-containing protein [Alphaproteobacteria bacterium]